MTTRSNLDEVEFLRKCDEEKLQVFPLSKFVKDSGAMGNARSVDKQVDMDNDEGDSESAHPPTVNRVAMVQMSSLQMQKNPISELHEFCATSRGKHLPPSFETIEISHQFFQCIAVVGQFRESAQSGTKQGAKTDASKKLLIMLKSGVPPIKVEQLAENKENVNVPNVKILSTQPNPNTKKSPVSLLFEYCAQMRKNPPEHVFEQVDSGFKCTLKLIILSENLFGSGIAGNKKEAKNLAAEDLLQKLETRKKSC